MQTFQLTDTTAVRHQNQISIQRLVRHDLIQHCLVTVVQPFLGLHRMAKHGLCGLGGAGQGAGYYIGVCEPEFAERPADICRNGTAVASDAVVCTKALVAGAFGFTQCPAICPTALARAAQIRKLMGEEGKTLQVVFITLDPERDTPEVIDAYVKAFDPTFVALSGTLEETAATAKEFGVFFEKVPLGDTYTISHTATSYVYDTRGVLRLGLSHRLSAQQCTEDLLTLMEVC